MNARTFSVEYRPDAEATKRIVVKGATAADKAFQRLLWNTDVDLDECSCSEGDPCPPCGFKAALAANHPPGVLAFPKPTALAVAKKSKRATRAQTIAEIRRTVMARAHGRCECGCRRRGPLELDHVFGGSKKRSLESVETCWALLHEHHDDKTNNRPSAAFWAEKFRAHCLRQGYALPELPKKARTA